MKLPRVVLAITASLFFCLPALSPAKSMQVEGYTFSELKVEQEHNLIMVSGYVEGRPLCYALSIEMILKNQYGKKVAAHDTVMAFEPSGKTSVLAVAELGIIEDNPNWEILDISVECHDEVAKRSKTKKGCCVSSFFKECCWTFKVLFDVPMESRDDKCL